MFSAAVAGAAKHGERDEASRGAPRSIVAVWTHEIGELREAATELECDGE